MKLKEFRKKMQKQVFSTAEAHVVAFNDNPKLINLQLHQWKKNGGITQLKRGVFVFEEAKPDIAELAKMLCSPCYFSLEYVLSLHGIIPDAVFTYTLVTSKKTRQYVTPRGRFVYQSIKKNAFTGFDPQTLLAEPEKALADYFYLNSVRLHTGEKFWEESRLNPSGLDFKKVLNYAELFKTKKLITLVTDFKQYAKTH